MEVTISCSNKLKIDEKYVHVKTLPNDFTCTGLVYTALGPSEVELRLRRKLSTTTEIKGRKCQNIDVNRDEHLFTIDITGYLLPVIIEDSSTLMFYVDTYEVNVPETLLFSEFYLELEEGIYQRIGQRKAIYHRLQGLMSIMTS